MNHWQYESPAQTLWYQECLHVTALIDPKNPHSPDYTRAINLWLARRPDPRIQHCVGHRPTDEGAFEGMRSDFDSWWLTA